ncbi:MAG: DNA polymerase IV [Pseudobdellovibrio sp.]|nr:DNA polymerase IV [Pseudobdellovibrio sp.]
MDATQSLLKYLLVDLNSFFASCEQQDNPKLRNKPIAVVPMVTDSATIIASSVEAKRRGVKTLTKVGEAKRLCPGIIFVEGHHKRYTEYHHKIVKAVDEICPVEKVLSIDEMVCELIGREMVESTAIEIARKIKHHIETTVGECLTTSIGLGPNIMIAKMASDLVKPNGLVSVPVHKIGETFDHLPVEIISGIGPNMKRNLNAKGFHTVGQLRALNPHQLKAVWGGVVGLRLGEELAGRDVPRAENVTKGMSHEHVLPPQLRNPQGGTEILLKLATKLSARLREGKQKCKSLHVYMKDQYGLDSLDKTISFAETDDTFFILQQVKKLTEKGSPERPVKVGVGVSGLSNSDQEQLSLFADPKTQKLGHVMDIINKKYGANTLIPGEFLDVTDQAKVKISFNHIPKIGDEFD